MTNWAERFGLVESDTPPEKQDDDQTPPVMAPVLTPQPAFVPGAVTLSPEDVEHMKALSAQVYAIPSSYSVFQKTREALGNPSDLSTVFKVFAAANPGVTPQKVLADIDAHLGIIVSKRTEFDTQIAQARAARIDGPATEIANLTAQNQQAANEIAARTAKIAQLEADRKATEQKLSDGAARFKIIEDQLSAPLLQSKQLLSTLS